jgi:hypothetical protein
MWVVKVTLMTGKKEVMYEEKFSQNVCAIFDGDFHIDFSNCGSRNVGCYNIMETV